jgi:hypothetical protein
MSAPLDQAQHRQPATTSNTTGLETFKGLPASSAVLCLAANPAQSVFRSLAVARPQSSYSPLYALTHAFLI